MVSPLSASSVTLFKTGIDQAGNIAYLLRGIYRGEIVPKHRRIDYMYRGVFMTMVNTLMTELVFRFNNFIYIMPQLTKILGLNRLSAIYHPEKPDRATPFLSSFNLKEIKDYRSIEEIDPLRRRTCESAFKPESIHLVPALVEDDLKAKLKPEEFKNTEALRLHLRRRLNYDGPEGYLDFLKQHHKITQEEWQHTKDALKELRDIIEDVHSNHKSTKAGQAGKLKTFWNKIKNSGKNIDEAAKHLSERLNDMSIVDKKGAFNDDILNELKNMAHGYAPLQGWFEKLARYEKELPRVAALIEDGYVSRKVAMAIRKVQKSGFWPKIITNMLLTFVVYGYCSSNFEIDVVLPWQRKIFKARGETDEAIRPAVLATLPAVAAFYLLKSERFLGKALQKTGYLPELLLAGLAGLGAYLATFFYLFNQTLKKPPKHPPIDQPLATETVKLQPLSQFPAVPPVQHPGPTMFQLPQPAFQLPVTPQRFLNQ